VSVNYFSQSGVWGGADDAGITLEAWEGLYL